ncbi:arsenate reductase ArsC [Georgenia deserti]|uniref:Arsenate reductase ArsC n=1 Tax=Georgenia deserti TaxID=2093781 RepID=A0ABW4L6I0_9MICO
MDPTPAGGHGLPGLLSPEHELHTITDDLTAKFHGVFAEETVERVVFESHAALARTATVTAHLPVLAGKFAQDRLTALAQAKGAAPHDVPEVLFLCSQNAGRSQMAAALLDHAAAGRVHVRSAGTVPSATIHPEVVTAMEEIGVDITHEFPKPLTDDVVRAADVVISMGCGDVCPIYPGKRYEGWDIEDPAETTIEAVRRIRDEIDGRVRTLLAELASEDDRTATLQS